MAAIGIDVQGKKHVLGLWHGATENAAVVKDLLEDLVARGLESERKILVVLDGTKALCKWCWEKTGWCSAAASIKHAMCWNNCPKRNRLKPAGGCGEPDRRGRA